ncbi:MAG TPA: NAD(P)/FAD-dependent oxidoreductase [Acidobacteriota bacterium]|nr:NAD(P)/FAD-dependent oxidoreductase [Acidobacteriota bacterium]
MTRRSGHSDRDRIAVVGGGPAGLSAALTAARLGLPCVLFEKGEIGGNIQCAEGIYDPAGVLTMDKAFIRTRIRHARLHVNGRSFTFDIGSRNRFFVIDRGEWQAELGRRARAAGVAVREGERADPFALQDDFRAVVDARGMYAFYSRWHEFDPPPGFGLQWTLEGDFSAWANTIDVKILEEQPGYFWIFPKGTRQANVGFGWLTRPAAPPWEILEGYLEANGIAGYRRVRKIGGFLVGTCPQPPFAGQVIRAGDAGGFASALHGGGIDAAWLTGRLAVETVARGEPAHFLRELNRKLGLMRCVEQRVMDKWLAEGPAALERAGRLLEENGPLLRASVRFITSGLLGAAVRRVFQGAMPREFYRLTDQI